MAGEPEVELEAFRRRWREEVTARNQSPIVSSAKLQRKHGEQQRRESTAAVAPISGPSTARRKDLNDFSEELEPKAYHDLPDKDEDLRLGTEGQNHDRSLYKEPSSALEHYERAVERESQGNLGSSMQHYRKAFKVRLLVSSVLESHMLR